MPGGIANQDGIASPADQQDAYCYTCEVPLQENATPGQYSVTVRAWGYTMDGERVNLDCQISSAFRSQNRLRVQRTTVPVEVPEEAGVTRAGKVVKLLRKFTSAKASAGDVQPFRCVA
ncbi:MAG: hypothetical protein ACLSCO_17785 [Gallintestinimicrobium sp.]